jgi:hypothetical protein
VKLYHGAEVKNAWSYASATNMSSRLSCSLLAGTTLPVFTCTYTSAVVLTVLSLKLFVSVNIAICSRVGTLILEESVARSVYACVIKRL